MPANGGVQLSTKIERERQLSFVVLTVFTTSKDRAAVKESRIQFEFGIAE